MKGIKEILLSIAHAIDDKEKRFCDEQLSLSYGLTFALSDNSQAQASRMRVVFTNNCRSGTRNVRESYVTVFSDNSVARADNIQNMQTVFTEEQIEGYERDFTFNNKCCYCRENIQRRTTCTFFETYFCTFT